MLLCVLLLMIRFYADGARPHLRHGDSNVAEEQCHCVPTHLCADNDVGVNGQGLLDVRLDNNLCPNYFEVCCDNPIKDSPKQKEFQGCGFQTPIGMIPRITTDSEKSIFGELPWTVVILLRDGSNNDRNMYLCGGSLIHPQVALTAAHCIAGIQHDHLTVRAGEWNTRTQDEPLPHQDKSVQETFLHPHYNSGSLKNDIALLFLSEAVIVTDNIGIICLPPHGLKLKEGKCIASGWGKDAFKRGKHSSILKKVDLPIVTREKCLSALKKTRLGSFYNLHQSFICAGGEKDKDTCKGDGGSPLVCPISGQSERYFQLGIVSWGIGCGENETPGVYVNVPLYTEWIDKQLTARNFDTSVYKY